MTKFTSLKLWVLVALLVPTLRSVAQTVPEPATEKSHGFTAVEAFQGTVNSDQRLLKLDSALGWDFNSHFSTFAGLPVYFDHLTSTSTATTASSNPSHNGIGNAYLGLALQEPNRTLSYASALTVAAPTGDTKKGLSTGRATVDWDNHLQHAFHRFTPFFDGGLGNTVPDTALITRPFTSLGFVTHLQEGGGYLLSPHFAINASAYEIVPFGNQKVFSKLVAPGQAARGSGAHGRVFDVVPEASGNGLTRENGFSTWASFELSKIWAVDLGYTRSVTFDLNSFAFNLRMNVGRLLRSGNTL
jgi:hypothetical protein